MNDLDNLIEQLERIEKAIQSTCIDMRIGDQPGVVEGGFMRMISEQKETNSQLARIADALYELNHTIKFKE